MMIFLHWCIYPLLPRCLELLLPACLGCSQQCSKGWGWGSHFTGACSCDTTTYLL